MGEATPTPDAPNRANARATGILLRLVYEALRCLPAVLLPLVMVLSSGCTSTSIHPPVHVDLSNRLLQIKTVAVSPPYVIGYVTPYHLSETKRIPLSPAAASNITSAVREQFGQAGRLVLQDLELGDSGSAPKLPPWSVFNPASDEAGYGPALHIPEGMEFKSGAFTAYSPDTGLDAVLMTFAWENTKTAGGMSKTTFNLLTPWLYPLLAVFDLVTVRPDSAFLAYATRREVCLGICLIDCRTGALLWSDIEFAYGGRELKDPETSRRLVKKAWVKLGKYMTP